MQIIEEKETFFYMALKENKSVAKTHSLARKLDAPTFILTEESLWSCWNRNEIPEHLKAKSFVEEPGVELTPSKTWRGTQKHLGKPHELMAETMIDHFFIT